MATKMSLGNPYGVLPKGCGVYPTLNEMLLEKQEAMIKKITPKRDFDEKEWNQQLSCYPELQDEPHPPQPKLWYLIVVLKKAGISLEQVGDEMGLRFLGNVIHQFKLLKSGSCNYVCFLYNYFQKVSPDDWPAKHAILEKLTK